MMKFLKKINVSSDKNNIYNEIFEFIIKYKNIVKKNIDIENFVNNLDKCRNELNQLFKLFLDSIYDDNDEFFKGFFNDNNQDEIIEESKEQTEIINTYTDEELIKKFEGFHISSEPYKNKDLYEDNFEEINDKKK